MKHRGAGILHTDGKKVLLLYRSQDTKESPLTWASAGGHIEDNENLMHAARRETQEEIGKAPGNKIAEFTNDLFVMYIFKVNKPFQPKLNHEHTQFKWVELDKVLSYKLHPNFRKEWPEYLNAIQKNNHSFAEWVKMRQSP